MSNTSKETNVLCFSPNNKIYQRNRRGKTFNFKELLDTLALGISKWALSYNIDKDKFETFLSRYDRIISDKRMTTTYYNDQYRHQ